MDIERVQIAVASDEAEASVINGLLEAQGIPVYYEGEGELGSPDPAAFETPRAVFVRAEDADAARRALAEAEAGA